MLIGRAKSSTEEENDHVFESIEDIKDIDKIEQFLTYVLITSRFARSWNNKSNNKNEWVIFQVFYVILIMKSNLWYRPSGNYKNVFLGSWFSQGPSSLGKNWQLEVHSTCCSGVPFPGRILWCTDLSRRETTIMGLETL